jgi:uncharacterized protein (TIGR03437 family)
MSPSCSFDFIRYLRAQWICLFLAIAGMGSASEHTVNSQLLSLPLNFEANRGQTDPTVKFLSRGNGYALFLTSDSAVFKLRSFRKGLSPAVVRMKLAGANSRAKVSGAEALPGKVNYFMGNDPNRWATGVTTFGKVRYQQIYRGIDLAYYGTGRQLEYDFIIAPGADPNQIALEFSGATPTLGVNGDLVLTADGAPLILREPVVFQFNQAGGKDFVAASYQLTGDRVRFALGQYDHSRALVIDPVLEYLTYLGGSKADLAGNTTYGGNTTQGMVVDSAGNVYVTGSTQSTDFPLQNPIQGTNTTNAYTGFVTKLNPAGSQLIYSTYIGGGVLNDNTTTRPYAIAVDSTGNAYVTGFTNGPQFPVTGGAYQMVCGFLLNNKSNCPGAQSAFLSKLGPSGSLVYSTFLGHTDEIGVAVAVDSHGQAYVAGSSTASCASNDPGACFPTTGNAVLQGSAFNNTLNQSNFNQGSAFISVFDAAGANLLYSSMFGGNGNPAAGNNHSTFGSGVAVDSSGDFYLVGTTGSNQLPATPGAFQTTYYGNPNAGFGTSTRGFVARFKPVSSGASLVYATYLGGFDKTVVSYQDVISGVAADAAGNAYVSGNASYDFPATAGANNSTPCPAANSCANRGFLAKLNPAGSALVWATFVGTGLADPTLSSASTISPPRLDAQGNLYVSGIAGNNTEYPLVNPLQPANGFGGVYVTMYDPTGSKMYFSTVIYDPSANGGVFNSGVDVDSLGNIYVAGYTAQTGLPTTAGAFQRAISGNYDAFIAKISAAGPPVPTIQSAVPSFIGNAGVSPNMYMDINGANFTDHARARTPSDSPTELDGVGVTIDGKAAFVNFISPGQINVNLPADSATGSVPVQVNSPNGLSNTVSVTLAAVSPAMWTEPQFLVNGKQYVAAVTTSFSSYIGHPNMVPGLFFTLPKAGDTVTVFALGCGPTTPATPPGAIVSKAAPLALPYQVSIGGTAATVSSAESVAGAIGLYQFNIVIPAVAAADQSIQLTVDGVANAQNLFIPVGN